MTKSLAKEDPIAKLMLGEVSVLLAKLYMALAGAESPLGEDP